jgi:penicillin amidase
VWREHLLTLLDSAALEGHPLRGEARRLIETWSGRAAVDDAGYRVVRGFRLYARSRVLEPLTAPCATVSSPCGWEYYGQRESAVRTLLEDSPPHLLDPRYESWRALELGALDHLLGEFTKDGSRLSDHPWGDRNTVRVVHPMTPALPDVVAEWFNMPERPLPGDWHMPRVQSPTFGASERLVVSPGREEDGLFHMPAGQSGHPRSPYYGAGHQAWENGDPTPLLPGPARWQMELVPG